MYFRSQEMLSVQISITESYIWRNLWTRTHLISPSWFIWSWKYRLCLSVWHFSSVGLHRLLLQKQEVCGSISKSCITSLCAFMCLCVCVWERDWTPVKSKLPLCSLPESPVGENSVCLGAQRDWWIIKACWSFTHSEPADHWDTTTHTLRGQSSVALAGRHTRDPHEECWLLMLSKAGGFQCLQLQMDCCSLSNIQL